MKSINKKLENIIISEIRELGFSEIRINEKSTNGKERSQVYVNLRSASKRMINFAHGYFPIYQKSVVTCAGYKMTIIMN